MTDDTKALIAKMDVTNKLLFKIIEKQDEIIKRLK